MVLKQAFPGDIVYVLSGSTQYVFFFILLPIPNYPAQAREQASFDKLQLFDYIT